MKIAILGIRGIPSGYSGYETFAQQVGPRLVERGHEVTVYCRRSLFKDRPKEFKGIKLVYLPSIQTKSLSTFSHSCLAALHLAFRRADVALFVNVANSPFCLITKLAGIKTALNVDGLEWLRPKWGPTGKKYFHMSARISKWTTHQIITDATRMQEVYREEFGVESEDIAYGADVFGSNNQERVREVGLEPGKYFLTACRLVPDNNVHVLLDAFEQSSTDITYGIVGGTPYASAYVDEVTSRDDSRLKFLGYVEDQTLMDELYANAFTYLHAHEFGGTNPTLLRAMAGGNCVIALDTPFNREVLGDCGLFFNKGDDSLGRQIQFLLDHPEERNRMAEGAIKRIQERYSWELITDRYEQLCARLAK